MTIALLATGDEIVYGDTLNTNSHHLAHALSSEGLPAGLHLSCTDKEDEILDCINFLIARHDILIFTGGLGPTSDDRTRFALERFLGEPLIEFPEAIEHIENRLRAAKLGLSSGNRQQALFPVGSIILPNPNGTAMGCYYSWNNKIFVLLPGPPRECLPMFNAEVLPRLQKTEHNDKELFKWRLFGVAESTIAHQIDEALAGIDCETGYRLETPYVECKVRCAKELSQTVKTILEPIITPHIIVGTDKKASELLYETIIKLQIPITIVDEVSGGILQTLLLRPDSHRWLSFQDNPEAKIRFHLKGLEEYWSLSNVTGSTTLNIHYKKEGTEGNETKEIPYRSPLVVHYAAEWLSFRLFHLINQLHQSIA